MTRKSRRNYILAHTKARLGKDAVTVAVKDIASAPVVGALGCTVRRGKKFGRGKVLEMLVPTSDSALDRTVRIHETLHAQIVPLRPPDAYRESPFCQVIEDGHIHGKFPRVSAASVKRDARSVALREVRSVLRIIMDPMVEVDTYNLCVGALLRSKSLWRGAYSESKRGGRRGNRRPSPWCSFLDHRYFKKNIEKLSGAQQKRLHGLDWKLDEIADVLRTPHKATNVERPNAFASPALRAMTDAMKIEDLQPKTVAIDAATPDRYKTRVSSGRKLNMRLVPQCIAANRSHGLFSRTRVVEGQLGGTILVDASGSMGWDYEILREIFHRLPLATVAYYSSATSDVVDRSSNGRPWGVLAIAAQDGLLYDGVLPRYGGGNNVDFWALDWLLQQPEPRLFVTDQAFCGGHPLQADAAMALLAANPSVHVMDNAEELLELLDTPNKGWDE